MKIISPLKKHLLNNLSILLIVFHLPLLILPSCDTLTLRNVIQGANQITNALTSLNQGFDQFSEEGDVQDFQNQFEPFEQYLLEFEQLMASQSFSQDLKDIQNFYNQQYRDKAVDIRIILSDTFEKLSSLDTDGEIYQQNILLNQLKEAINRFIEVHNEFLSLLEEHRENL